MHTLFDGIPLDEMNTSMTINATAAWLLALYMTTAEENGVPRDALQGTTQNDIIKEFLSRGTYAFPPEPSLRLIADMIAFTVDEVPKWNPINICSYHLQEAGATPVQEIAYAISTAQADCATTTVRRILTFRSDGESAKCRGSSHNDQLRDFSPHTPPSTTTSTSNDISTAGRI